MVISNLQAFRQRFSTWGTYTPWGMPRVDRGVCEIILKKVDSKKTIFMNKVFDRN
jgi:hypothetical protein